MMLIFQKSDERNARTYTLIASQYWTYSVFCETQFWTYSMMEEQKRDDNKVPRSCTEYGIENVFSSLLIQSLDPRRKFLVIINRNAHQQLKKINIITICEVSCNENE